MLREHCGVIARSATDVEHTGTRLGAKKPYQSTREFGIRFARVIVSDADPIVGNGAQASAKMGP